MALSDILRTGARGLGGMAPGIGTALGATFGGGPIGASIGAGLGSGLGSLLSQLGTPRDSFSSQAAAAQKELLGQMRQPIQPQMGSFEPIAQAEQRRFQEDILPGIASQFGPNQRRSSAFAQSLGSAGSDLSSRLASMREQFEAPQRQFYSGQEQQRQANLANMLQGQQQIGQTQQGMRQQRLGAPMQQGMQGLQFLSNQQAQQDPLMALFNAAGLGTGQGFETVTRGGTQGAGGPMLGALMKALQMYASGGMM